MQGLLDRQPSSGHRPKKKQGQNMFAKNVSSPRYKTVPLESEGTEPPSTEKTPQFVCAVLRKWFRAWLQELAYFARWNPVSLSLSRIAFVGIYTAILTSLYLRNSLHIPGISPTVPSSILTAVTFFTSSVYARAESRRTQNIREFNMFLQALMSLALALHYRLGGTPQASPGDNGRGDTLETDSRRKVAGLIEQLQRILDTHIEAAEKGRTASDHACQLDLRCVRAECRCADSLKQVKHGNCTRTAMLGAQLQLSRLRFEVSELPRDQACYFEPLLLELEQSVRRVSGHYVPEISRVVTIFAYTSVWAWTIYLPFALIPTTQGYISTPGQIVQKAAVG